MPRATKPHEHSFLSEVAPGRERLQFKNNQTVFSQGDAAESIYYIQRGRVKLSVLSREDKTAVVAIVQAGEFFGEGCLAGQKVRISTATTIGPCAITRIEKQSMQRHLQRDPAFSAKFVRHLLARNIRIEEDLVDQIFNSTEKRLARVLLLLANFGKEKKPDRTVPRVSQTILAEIVGTTRTRINILMNRFRKLGFIDYNGGLQVHSTLLKVILHD